MSDDLGPADPRRGAKELHGTQVIEKYFLIGPSGSGKSALASMVAESVSAKLFDTDAMILTQLGADSIADVFDTHGEEHFRILEREAIEHVAISTGLCVVATGGGLPAIPGMMARLNHIGVTIYLRASVDTMWKRLSMDPESLKHRPLLRQHGREALAQLVALRQPIYQRASIVFDTDRLTADQVGEILVKVVERTHR